MAERSRPFRAASKTKCAWRPDSTKSCTEAGRSQPWSIPRAQRLGHVSVHHELTLRRSHDSDRRLAPPRPLAGIFATLPPPVAVAPQGGINARSRRITTVGSATADVHPLRSAVCIGATVPGRVLPRVLHHDGKKRTPRAKRAAFMKVTAGQAALPPRAETVPSVATAAGRWRRCPRAANGPPTDSVGPPTPRTR